jgi:hypothetical protein
MPASYPAGLVAASTRRVERVAEDRPAAAAPAPSPDSDGVAPDVTGLSARQALALFGRRKVAVRLSGAGFVISQVPQPGAPLQPGGTVTLSLSESAPSVARAGVAREETGQTPYRP